MIVGSSPVAVIFTAENESKNDILSYVPQDIKQSSLCTLVYSNCDRNPGFFSCVSMHCTNGILIQRQENALLQYSSLDNVSESNTTKELGNKRYPFIPIAINVFPYYNTEKHFMLPLMSGLEKEEN